MQSIISIVRIINIVALSLGGVVIVLLAVVLFKLNKALDIWLRNNRQ